MPKMPHMSASQRRRGAMSHRPREGAPHHCLGGPAHGLSAPVEQRRQTRRIQFDPDETALLPSPVELVRLVAPEHIVFFCSFLDSALNRQSHGEEADALLPKRGIEARLEAVEGAGVVKAVERGRGLAVTLPGKE